MKSYIERSFLKNVIVLATGTAGAQAITMLFAPMITRMYGPEFFGLLGVFTSILMVLAPVVALTYPIAIVLPEKEHEALGVVNLSLMIAVFISSVIAVITIVWGSDFLKMVNAEKVAPYSFLIPVAVLFMAFLQVCEQLSIRHKKFNLTAKSMVFKSLVVGGMQTVIGFFNPVAGALIITFVLGVFLQSVFYVFSLKKILYKEASKCNAEKFYFYLAKKYIDFPIYRAPQVFVNFLSLGMPVLILSMCYGSASAGYYSLAISVLGVPSLLIGKSVGDVFYQKIVENVNKSKPTDSLLIKSSLSLGIVGALPYLIIFSWGGDLFSIVFGNEWYVAGEFASWLSVWFWVSLAARPAIAAISPLKLQKFFLKHECVGAIFRAFGLFLGFVAYNSDLATIIIFSVINAILYLILIIFVCMKSKDRLDMVSGVLNE